MSKVPYSEVLKMNPITEQMATLSGLQAEVLDVVGNLGLGRDGRIHPGAVEALIDLATLGKVETAEDFNALMVMVGNQFPAEKLPQGAIREGGLFSQADFIWDTYKSGRTRPAWDAAVAAALPLMEQARSQS